MLRPLQRLVGAPQLRQYIDAGAPLVVYDVRRSADYGAGHVIGALSLPLGSITPGPSTQLDLDYRRRLSEAFEHVALDSRLAVVVVADGGTDGMADAALACALIELTGHDNCHILEGGHPAWTKGGGATSKEASHPARAPARPARPLERPPTLTDLDALRRATVEATPLILDVRSRPVEESIPGALTLTILDALEEDGHVDRKRLARFAEGSPLLAESSLLVIGERAHDTAAAWFLLSHGLGLEDVRFFLGGMRRYRTIQGLPLGPAEQAPEPEPASDAPIAEDSDKMPAAP